MKKIQQIGILLLSCAILVACQNEDKEVKTEDIAADFLAVSYIDSLLAANEFNGVLLITKGKDTIYYEAKGVSDLKTATPLKKNDQFVIGSISKQITAVLVMRAMENGQLGLQDKISKYLKNIKQPWVNEISIHHLLTHTHGITDIAQPLAFEVGKEFQYSQLGYDLLAQIVEKVQPLTFEELSNQLFAEFGMSATFHPAAQLHQDLVKGYEITGTSEALLYTETNALENYVAAGGFISTAADLNRWNALLYGNKLVKPETLALMKMDYATREHPIFDNVQYGYGLLFKKGDADTQIGALGYVPGFVSAAYFYPKTGVNLVVLQNIARDLEDFKQTFKTQTALMEKCRAEK